MMPQDRTITVIADGQKYTMSPGERLDLGAGVGLVHYFDEPMATAARILFDINKQHISDTIAFTERRCREAMK
jgi:uncharacterized cupin superfamily protein